MEAKNEDIKKEWKKYGEMLFYDSFSWQSNLLTYRSYLVQHSHASEQTYLTMHTTIGL
jgi:hypothetical protein